MSSLNRELSAGYMTNWAARLFAKVINEKLRPLGLSTTHLPVFFALDDGKALTQKALAEFASVEQPTMAITLTRMERDGLIQKAADPKDKRSALVTLTPKAMEKVQLVRDAVASSNATALSGLSESEREIYFSLLRKVSSSLGDAGGEQS